MLSRRTIISTCLSACLSVYLHHLCIAIIHVSVCLSVINLYLSLFIYYLHLSVTYYLSFYLSSLACLSLHPSVCLSLYLSYHTCLSVCLCLFTVKGRWEGQSSETRTSRRLNGRPHVYVETTQKHHRPAALRVLLYRNNTPPPTHTHITGRQKRFWLEGLCSLIHPHRHRALPGYLAPQLDLQGPCLDVISPHTHTHTTRQTTLRLIGWLRFH